jgi:hypothetical protein
MYFKPLLRLSQELASWLMLRSWSRLIRICKKFNFLISIRALREKFLLGLIGIYVETSSQMGSQAYENLVNPQVDKLLESLLLH